MATSSSPDSSPLTASAAKALVEKSGFNASLPFAVLDAKGSSLFANPRMLEIWKGKGGKPDAASWPFFNEESSAQAVFGQLIALKAKATLNLNVEAKLKTYRILARVAKDAGGRSVRLVVAELLRSGDLLSDEPSRQTLFRSMAHEIRTSVSALKGYMEMLSPDKADDKHIVERMSVALVRLEKVVDRLSEFRAEIEKPTGKKR